MSSRNQADHFYMGLALRMANLAKINNEVPVGAVLINSNGNLVSVGYNLKEKLPSALGHAEIIAIYRASQKIKQWRLLDCTLYVTLEPCPMCAGAIVQSRIKRLVYGTPDPKTGAIDSLYQLGNDSRLNHQIDVTAGVRAEECSILLKRFFKERRE